VCRAGGFEIVFFDVAVRGLPRPLRDALLAHELAHVYQAATGHEFGEDDADRLVTAWGFPMRALRRWATRYTDALIGEAATA
jgi:hypothetical protein